VNALLTVSNNGLAMLSSTWRSSLPLKPSEPTGRLLSPSLDMVLHHVTPAQMLISVVLWLLQCPMA
jgi:hypothetical protein